MKKKAIYYITIILTMLLLILNTYSYAADFTKESLTEFFNEYKKQESDWNDVKVTSNEIIITTTKGEEKIQYDLTSKPTFLLNLVFKNGMTYDECLDEEGKIVDLVLGFDAVAYSKGISLEDAMIYGLSTVSTKIGELQNTIINKDNYTNAIEYAQRRYGMDMTANEDLFDMKVKKGTLNGETYIVTVELVVNSEKDFSVLNGNFDEIGNQSSNPGNTSNKGNVTVTNTLVVEVTNTVIGDTTNKDNNKENTNTNTNLNTELKETLPPTDNKVEEQPAEKEDKKEEITTNETKSDVIKPVSTANITKMPNAGFAVNVLNIIKVILGIGIAEFILYLLYNKRYNSK